MLVNKPSKEQDRLRLEEVTPQDDCLSWHKYCDAECCKNVTISSDLVIEKDGFYCFRIVPSFDMAWYFKLHGIIYIHGNIKVPKEYCIIEGKKIRYHRRCSYLDDNNRCIGHPDRKPKICQQMILENVKKGCTGAGEVTSNCVYRYQLIKEGFYGPEEEIIGEENKKGSKTRS